MSCLCRTGGDREWWSESGMGQRWQEGWGVSGAGSGQTQAALVTGTLPDQVPGSGGGPGVRGLVGSASRGAPALGLAADHVRQAEDGKYRAHGAWQPGSPAGPAVILTFTGCPAAVWLSVSVFTAVAVAGVVFMLSGGRLPQVLCPCIVALFRKCCFICGVTQLVCFDRCDVN